MLLHVILRLSKHGFFSGKLLLEGQETGGAHWVSFEIYDCSLLTHAGKAMCSSPQPKFEISRHPHARIASSSSTVVGDVEEHVAEAYSDVQDHLLRPIQVQIYNKA
ncbi:hypothetical protein KSP40_PGU006597 [Platanthera guangdongensis]|uniref:Uncharacterized protein n=1 Tax=Platanthera guangdongensis TaxID=2320717 RepID=A0ABR2LXQ1_9ASPA